MSEAKQKVNLGGEENVISIHFFTEDKPLLIPISVPYSAEDMCIAAAKHCQIGPVCRHLFALQTSDGYFLSLCKVFDPTKKIKNPKYFFRLRFRIARIGDLKYLDRSAFNYCFYQMRADFLNGDILEILKLKDSALGLAVADMLRLVLEQNLSIDTVQKDYRSFLPKEINKNYKFGIKKPIQKALLEARTNCKEDAMFVKEQYMQQVYELVPDYGCEKYDVNLDEEQLVIQAKVTVDPFNRDSSGLRMNFQGKSDTSVHVCTIEELCHISIRENTVEISRRNGVPQYFRFNFENEMESFVSLLDGYYRLTCKWTFNLCKDLPTPSLMLLKALKCHGPVTYKFACDKIMNKGKNEVGNYIFRQSSQNYEEYKIDVCCDEKKMPETFILSFNDASEYCIMGTEETFPNVGTLLNYYHNNPIKFDVCLKERLPLSEYDQTNLLLCQVKDKDYQSLKLTAGDCKCSSKCIPPSAILKSISPNDTFIGKSTVVSRAFMYLGSGKKQDIFIKSLLPSSASKIQEFLSLANLTLFWQCDSIISTLGIVLANPLTLVTDYFPYGPLDKYLQSKKAELQEVDLVEAATYLAKALWYLEENGICHGKLRCHNMIVASHEDNSFKVKLLLPGLSDYVDNDIHWIPREFHHNFKLAKSSLAADVWAFGTCVWEIFSYGEKPPMEDVNEIKARYKQGITLAKPEGCHENVDKLMKECWVKDPDERKKPQAIMRDINQTLYEVYNSRRSHSYASIAPRNAPSSPLSPKTSHVVPPELPPKPTSSLSSRVNRSTIFKSAFDKFISHDVDETSDLISNNSSISTLTSSQCDSSSPSTVTFLSVSDLNESNDSNQVPVGSLICLSDSITDFESEANNHRNVQCLPSVNSLMSMDQSIWLIESHQLVLGPRLGQGFYGEVCKATLTQWSGLGKETVAVKSLKKSNFSISGFLDLQREISIMKSLQHKNIVEIKGVVEEPELLLVMEYVPLGSLLVYIKTYKEKLDQLHLLKFASNVAEGMEYLGMKNIVHRDLAARNILVAPNNQVKISDFGLAQVTGNPGHNPYYWLKTNRDLPIRWYALESIKYGKFSTKSDVWSFGVTLWEMFSYGEEPIIPGVKDDDLLFNLEKGIRLGCPDTCRMDIYHFMLSCWNSDSHSRPTFTVIRKEIKDLKENS